MREFIGYILCGLLNLVIVNKLLCTVKQKDKEISLPKQLNRKENFMIFLFGIVSFHGFCSDSIIFFLLSVYLSFMAYTDFYTRKVYSAFSYFIFLIGIFVFISKTQDWERNISWFVFCFILIVFGFIVKAYAFGDVEIYMALSPYYITMFLDGMFLFLYGFTLLTAVLTSIQWKPFGVEKTKAIAPVITFVHFFLTVVHLLFI